MRVWGILELPVSGRRIPLTEEDLLTAGKLAQYEGGRNDARQAAAILWTIAARLEYLPQYNSFTELAEDFAQPLNPKWRRDGVFCRPGGSYAGQAPCSEDRLARRDEAAHASWESLSSTAQSTALAFVTGRLPNPVPGAVDFASGSTAAAQMNNAKLRAVYTLNGQTYFASSKNGVATEDWPWTLFRVRGAGFTGFLSRLLEAVNPFSRFMR